MKEALGERKLKKKQGKDETLSVKKEKGQVAGKFKTKREKIKAKETKRVKQGGERRKNGGGG